TSNLACALLHLLSGGAAMARFTTLPAILLLWGCQAAPPPSGVLEAARSYADYGKVDDRRRRAPELCMEPTPPRLRTSASNDETTHGRKQYYLFAKERRAFLQARDRDQPEGQVIVKESWLQNEKGPLFLMMKSDGE